MNTRTPSRAHLIWLHGIAGMVLAMVVVGGITRLTGSGLSITDWAPLMGAIPPLNEAAWQTVFEKYQASPQFLKVNSTMTLAGFKFIFFWEYIHRLIARMIGVVVLIPGLYFWMRGQLPSHLRNRVAIGFLLGGMQGFVGWLMVKSGLIDRPSVSHFRLAAHFLLALTILSWFVWTIRDLQTSGGKSLNSQAWSSALPSRLTSWILGLLLVQLLYGAFVAGMKAGFTYNTFPRMNDEFFPSVALVLKPSWLNFFENPALIQWIHRYLAKTLLILSWVLYAKSRPHAELSRWTLSFAASLSVQFLLGVSTLLLHVPVWLGVLHQLMAGVLVILMTGVMHYVIRSNPPSRSIPAQSPLKNETSSSILEKQLS